MKKKQMDQVPGVNNISGNVTLELYMGVKYGARLGHCN
jgi:hypothetical protein